MKIKISKKNLILICVLALVFIAVIFVQNHPSLILSVMKLFNPSYETPAITFETYDSCDFAKTDGAFVAAYPDGIAFYDSSLKEKQRDNSSGTNPVIKTDGKNTLIYYGTEKRAVIKLNTKVLYISSDYPILNATVNKNGNFALVTEESGFKSRIVVYNKNGDQIYVWHSADAYLTDASLSDDGKMMVASALYSGNDGISSKVLVFSLSESKPIAQIDKKGEAIYSAAFCGGKKILVISDAKTGMYNTDASNIWEEDYSKKQLFTYNYSGSNIILATGNTSSATEKVSIKILSFSGRLKGEYTHQGEVLGTSIGKNGVLAYGKNSLTLISFGGREKSSVTLGIEIKKAFLSDDGKSVFAISNSIGKIYYLR